MVFFINENHVRPSFSYKMVFPYCKIPKDFTRVILNDRFWSMLLPFWFNMDSIRSTNISVNTSSYPIMSSFILFLSKFGKFTYNMVICLISPSTHSAYFLHMQCVNLPFNYISLNGLFLSCTYQTFYFTLSILRFMLIPHFLCLSYNLTMQHLFSPFPPSCAS